MDLLHKEDTVSSEEGGSIITDSSNGNDILNSSSKKAGSIILSLAIPASLIGMLALLLHSLAYAKEHSASESSVYSLMNSPVANVTEHIPEPEKITKTFKLLPTSMSTESFVIERWVYDPGNNYQETIVKYVFNTETDDGIIKPRRFHENFVEIIRTEEEPYAVFEEYRDFTDVTLYVNSDVTFETVVTNNTTK